METGTWGRQEIRAAEQYIRLQLSRWVRDEDDLDDVTQECLRKVWTSLLDFRGEAKVSTWLYRIAHNEAITFRRRSKRRDVIHEEWGEVVRDAQPRDLADDVTTRLEAQAVLESLPTIDRTILEMTFIHGMTSAEIGHELDLAASSVRCRINRVRQAARVATDGALATAAVGRAAAEAMANSARVLPRMLLRVGVGLVTA